MKLKASNGVAIPPLPDNPKGEPRKVGVEIEFSGLSAQETGEILARRFGGRLEMEDPHRYRVETPNWGKFVVELDLSSAHAKTGDELDHKVAELIGDLGSAFAPMEIASPPIAFTDLPVIDDMLMELNRHGAAGSQTGLLSAFGLHLNPEIARDDIEWIIDVFKAYLLASEWLRRDIGVNIKRRVTAFIDPFPADYVQRVVSPSYHPTEADFMDDYLEANPTRNRELDLLPLFAHRDPDRVRRQVDDERIKARPTFHYRLPDSRVGDLWWGVTPDWNRWVMVERLAADRDRLAEAGRAYVKYLDKLFSTGWPDVVEQWLERA